MRYYEENSLILSEQHGDSRYVYFLVEGVVDLIESVEMKVTTLKNKKTYSLYDVLNVPQLGRIRSLTVDLGKFLRERLDHIRSLSDIKLRAAASMRLSRHSAISAELPYYLSKSAIKIPSFNNEKGKHPKKTVKRTAFTQSYTQLLNELDDAKRVDL
ncbi:hypothetical protein HHI36_009870 [Cryptolaemus montrouzieri]|uniref:Cyclic nucleotide-binding domain-containing protein n=1 Tax=Cryptolaemus montrouzieri TaxID=559131 RepID=A0ABD2MH11_9CUCU